MVKQSAYQEAMRHVRSYTGPGGIVRACPYCKHFAKAPRGRGKGKGYGWGTIAKLNADVANHIRDNHPEKLGA